MAASFDDRRLAPGARSPDAATVRSPGSDEVERVTGSRRRHEVGLE